MSYSNSASTSINTTTGLYLSHWVKTATGGKVQFVGKSHGTGTLHFNCTATGCNDKLMVDESSFADDNIPSALQHWVNQHRHRANDNIRTKIDNYIAVAIKLASTITSRYDSATMMHSFKCSNCPGVTHQIHEDEFITGNDSRLQVPNVLTEWMITHKHEKTLAQVIADVKPLLNLAHSNPNWAAYKAQYDAAYKAQYDNITAKPMSVSWPGGTISSSVKPFFLPPIFGPEKLTPKMPKELSSNQVSDTDTLKTFKGRKFRK